ncbi:uncharacterized protein BXZ73DRAFT_99816 [Epithele typhae]|uniref:uncharacterized protein n=1 Tax=Epithele typhae TaxID=378194 RepID=UPI002008224E|nr:uncharacterized protein BXZ73DRAFT_99816 [Epithele typhae]KAH9938753.1 hypothetical protein BXZ73DRAFT_99816 [Epithele typhae]
MRHCGHCETGTAGPWALEFKLQAGPGASGARFSRPSVLCRGCLRRPDALLHHGSHDLPVRHAKLPGFLPGLEWHWPAFVDAARELGDTPLPEEQPEMGFLKKAHRVLNEVRPVPPFVLYPRTDPYIRWACHIHVEEGAMVCANCSYDYPLSNGFPNMFLAENEISYPGRALARPCKHAPQRYPAIHGVGRPRRLSGRAIDAYRPSDALASLRNPILDQPR